MRVEVKVPQLPESVAEATLVSWHKKLGDTVARDENLVDVETDKVVLELPAPQAGVLVEIRQGDGATVAGQQVIAVIDSDGKAGAAATAPAVPKAAAAHPRRQRERRRRQCFFAGRRRGCSSDFHDHSVAGCAEDHGRPRRRSRQRRRDGPRRADHQRRRDRRDRASRAWNVTRIRAAHNLRSSARSLRSSAGGCRARAPRLRRSWDLPSRKRNDRSSASRCRGSGSASRSVSCSRSRPLRSSRRSTK